MTLVALHVSRRIVAEAVRACSLPSSETQLGDGGLQQTFEELGFDSLAYMEFCIAIQSETGIELTVSAVADLGSPAAVAERLGGLR